LAGCLLVMAIISDANIFDLSISYLRPFFFQEHN
jgi:hypothetical protein